MTTSLRILRHLFPRYRGSTKNICRTPAVNIGLEAKFLLARRPKIWLKAFRNKFMRDPRTHKTPKVKVAVRQDALPVDVSVLGLLVVVVSILVLIGSMSGT